MAASILCRCCGNSIPNHRERRKLRSPAGVGILPTLVKLLGKRFAGRKNEDEVERLIFSEFFSSGTEPYICRQPCLSHLQKLQKLEIDMLELQTSIMSSLGLLYPSEESADSEEQIQLSRKRCTSVNDIQGPPTKRQLLESPPASRRLLFPKPECSEIGKSPSVTVYWKLSCMTLCRCRCMVIMKMSSSACLFIRL